MKSQQSIPMVSGHVAAIAVAVFALTMLGGQDNQLFPTPAINAAKSAPKLTSSLVAWISSQSENIIEEMDAIARQQLKAQQFSLVYYLRYLSLYKSLSVVASREGVDKFTWIARKMKAFERVHASIYDIIDNYLDDLDKKLGQIEMNEPKGKSVRVSAEWADLYETVTYIMGHAPKDSKLATKARDITLKSPTGQVDKVRSTRHLLFRRDNN